MTAPLGYLDAALRRMALPIRVFCLGEENRFPDPTWLMLVKRKQDLEYWAGGTSPAEATASYLALCRELDPTAS